MSIQWLYEAMKIINCTISWTLFECHGIHFSLWYSVWPSCLHTKLKSSKASMQLRLGENNYFSDDQMLAWSRERSFMLKFDHCKSTITPMQGCKNTISVAAHLRGMRSTSSIDKDIPAINEKLKTQNFNINQTHN